jgi:hypothetical protein
MFCWWTCDYLIIGTQKHIHAFSNVQGMGLAQKACHYELNNHNEWIHSILGIVEHKLFSFWKEERT